jgi:hypothetical protein
MAQLEAIIRGHELNERAGSRTIPHPEGAYSAKVFY